MITFIKKYFIELLLAVFIIVTVSVLFYKDIFLAIVISIFVTLAFMPSIITFMILKLGRKRNSKLSMAKWSAIVVVFLVNSLFWYFSFYPIEYFYRSDFSKVYPFELPQSAKFIDKENGMDGKSALLKLSKDDFDALHQHIANSDYANKNFYIHPDLRSLAEKKRLNIHSFDSYFIDHDDSWNAYIEFHKSTEYIVLHYTSRD